MPERLGQSAYGLTFRGLPRLEELSLAPTPATGPEVTIGVDPDRAHTPAASKLDDDGGVAELADGRVLAVDRQAATATFFGPPLELDMIAHPYLSPVAIAFSRWSGREVFHAGGFVSAGRAWIVLGPRTAGKSTLLAALAARGVDVLSDDVVVTDGAVVFQGPRCIDLREAPPSSSRHPTHSLHLTRARQDTRLRMTLPDRADPVPVGGWLYLQWAPAVAATRIAARDLLARLAVGRIARFSPSDPATLLALAALPAWDLARPRDWSALDDVVDLIGATLR
ncbi:hypothetical protein [Pengzhenrongella sicca]|uniref:HprK-related kinase A n=1 Tax=Pengzhenrongella sicca TaxID=2819238 RepID=A0A8A4ZDM7_9MICO|nr:hypothetical protein [Pengzhenrongella sicca]QTE29425.1 hypothetical protein J4E96_19540 [Pengzhenrongella sicca]